MADRTFGFRTRALHAGGTPDAEHGARAVPIYQTTSFVFKDTQDAANLFALQKYGNIYSRIGNPTVAAFEERIASLEGGIGAVATSSGMAAEFITFAALTQAGDHIVAASQLYGGTVTQLDVTLRRFGVDTTFVPGTDPADYAAAIRENTKAIFVEVVANPSSEVQDLEGLAEVAHDAGIPLVVDATLSTPYLVRPIEHGADIVIHSATKFLGGHGTTLGGVIVESGRFNWGNGKFPTMTEPVASYGNVSWWGNFGEYGFLTKLRCEQLRDIGPALSPQSAFQLLQGVETLPQRLDEHLRNAQAVAEWLEADERVAYVNFSGLPSHPHFERARKYLPLGPGLGVLLRREGRPCRGPEVHRVAAAGLHLANVGDSRTLVIHPGSTTHQQLSPEQLDAAGVPEDLVRISDRPRRHRGHPLGPRPGAGRGVGGREPDGIRGQFEPAGGRLHDWSAVMSTRRNQTWTGPSAPERLNLLRQAKSIAIVGASDKPSRASYFVATYLQSSTRYKVYFVNPVVKEILGEPTYASLADLPESPDIVDVFRKHDDLPGVLDEAIAAGAKTLWLQLGSWHEDVAKEAEAAGLDVVMDRCVKIEHARFHGGLHLAGFDTGVISSKRQVLA